MIRASSIRPGVDRILATLRSRRDALLGATAIEIHPAPDDRREGTGNHAVLSYLARKHPELVAIRGDDVHEAVRAAARAVWNPRTSTLAQLALAAGPALAKVIAARLRSGQYVTNTEETSRQKARRGLSTIPGVATGALADALDNATVTPVP